LPSEKPARRLEDIIENAQAIQRYIAGMDLDAFASRGDRLWNIVQIDLRALNAGLKGSLWGNCRPNGSPFGERCR
jgi:hypothetical protein